MTTKPGSECDPESEKQSLTRLELLQTVLECFDATSQGLTVDVDIKN